MGGIIYMKKAVIFDMYETLITIWNADNIFRYQGKEIAKDMGISEPIFREIWDTTEEDRTKGIVTFEEVIERILRTHDIYTKDLLNLIVDKRMKASEDYCRHMHPQIIPMIESLKQAGIKIGLITNCYPEEKVALKKGPLYMYFDVICMSCDLGVKKPQQEIFEICIEKLGVKPEECLYIGDGGSYELESATRAGMEAVQAIWYLKEGTGQPVGRIPEFPCIAQPMEIKELIMENTCE